VYERLLWYGCVKVREDLTLDFKQLNGESLLFQHHCPYLVLEKRTRTPAFKIVKLCVRKSSLLFWQCLLWTKQAAPYFNLTVFVVYVLLLHPSASSFY